MSKEKNFLGYFSTNSMKGIAIIFVIFSHLKLFPGIFANIGVATFFILSGFGLTRSYLKRGLSNYISSKILKVWLPYFIVTILWIIIDFSLEIHYSFFKIILNLIGLAILSPIDPTMWYITALFMWYTIFYLVFKLKVSNRIKFILVFIFGFIVFLILNFGLTDIGIVQHYSFCFPLGLGLGFYYAKINDFLNNKKTFIMSIAIICILFLGSLFFDKGTPNFITLTTGAMLLIALVDYINIYLTKTPVIGFIGKYSYELYLIEGVFIYNYSSIFEVFDSRLVQVVLYLLIVCLLAFSYGYLLNNMKKIIKF